MHKTLLGLISCKKKLLALIFGLTILCLNKVAKVGVSQVPPAKSTPPRASKRLKKAATVSTSLEVHRPAAFSDNVSSASCNQFFLLIYLFLHTFVLQTLMQKFLSLGAECVGF
jgi:hypothetical protein